MLEAGNQKKSKCFCREEVMAKYNSKSIYQRFLMCPSCGNVNTLWSNKRKIRPVGHIKTMNCYFCGKLGDLVEVRERTMEEAKK